MKKLWAWFKKNVDEILALAGCIMLIGIAVGVIIFAVFIGKMILTGGW